MKISRASLAFALVAGLAASSAVAALPCEAQARDYAALAADEEPSGEVVSVPMPRRDLRRGEVSQLVSLVREGLGLTASGSFDAQLEAQVRAQQEALGFNASGIVDPHTFVNSVRLAPAWRKAVAEHAAEECARVNRLLEQRQPARYIEVNVASQVLVAYERNPDTGDSHEVLRSRVVVGTDSTRTPLEDFDVWAVKFNPGWTPTTNIVSRSLIRGDKVNISWLADREMRVTDASGRRVDYSEITTENWRSFRYYQPASADAALGVLKLETTSGKNIYLHDTPDKAKFRWNTRTASSGCVRVEEIETLARWAFGALDDNQAEQAFDAGLAKGHNLVRKLPSPVPVYFTYRQVDFDELGNATFYGDPYAKLQKPVLIERL